MEIYIENTYFWSSHGTEKRVFIIIIIIIIIIITIIIIDIL